MAAAREAVAEQPPSPTLGPELLSMAALLGRESTLRAALTDTGMPGERRAELAATLLAGKVSEATVATVQRAVAQRWSSPRDLVEGVEALGAEAMLAEAEDKGRIDAVEEELFRFTRVLASSSDLQVLLTDPAVPDAAKAKVVADLLEDKAQPETVALVSHAVGHAQPGHFTVCLDGSHVMEKARAIRPFRSRQEGREEANRRLARNHDFAGIV